jgi:hypothetical protein
MTQGTGLWHRASDSFTHVAEILVPALICVFFAVFVCSRDHLAWVARNDRAIQRIESVPVLWAPWGMYAADDAVPDAIDSRPEAPPSNSITGSLRRTMGKILDKPDKALNAYIPILQSRFTILLGLIPAFLALCWAGYLSGAAKRAIRLRDGYTFSTRIHDYCVDWMLISFGLVIACAALPLPISSWLYLIPMASSVFAVRAWKAERP